MATLAALKKDLAKTSPEYIVLLETTADRVSEVEMEALKSLTARDRTAIIVSASRPCTNFLGLLKKNGVDTKNVFLLDCVCRTQSVDPPDAANVVHLQSAFDLTNLAISLDEAFRKIQGEKFLFLDSITTMLIYNQPDMFARFIHSVLTRMRGYGIGGVLISLEKETNPEVRSQIAQLCDKLIKVE